MSRKKEAMVDSLPYKKANWWYRFVKRSFDIWVSLIAILICSCQSNAEKKYQEIKDLTEQHIKDLDNAKTKEEAIKIRVIVSSIPMIIMKAYLSYFFLNRLA